MDKLSIEQKAKAYDEVIEKLRDFYRDYDTISHLIDVKEELANLIHELKDVKDDEIRKEIISALKWANHRGVYDKHIAWLEKQGKKEYALKSSKDEDVRKFVQCIEKQARAYDIELPNRGYDIYAFAKDVLCWLEKQGENPVEEYNITGITSGHAKGKLAEIIKDIESADKVEPKFKIDDFVVDNCGYVWKIKEILNQCYLLEDVEGGESRPTIEWVNKTFHLWTIQDAKVGDILFQDLMGGKTFIYNGVNPDMAILYSFIISNDGEDVLPYHIGKPNTGIGYIEENKNIIHPAIKEQRELLEKAMADAGWEFDFDEKELKKIENVEISFGAKDSELQEATYFIPKGFHAEIDDDKVVIKKGEKPTDWSKEDEEMLEDVRDNFEYNKGEMTDSLIAQYDKFFDKIKFLKPQPKQKWTEEDEQYLLICKNALAKYQITDKWDANIISHWLENKLKSFKDRYTWKPSEEQMKALRFVKKAKILDPEERELLNSLYIHLKKL